MPITKQRTFTKIICISALILMLFMAIFRRSFSDKEYNLHRNDIYEEEASKLTFSNNTSNEKTKSLNSTLGFEHIYVVSLPKRPDRRIKMDAMLNALNLNVEYFDAVSTEDYKTLNRFKDGEYMTQTHKACYVSHYLIHLSIAYNRYESALILEDDVDIELDVVSIMTYIHSVLPSDWDILYVGHCMNWEGSFDPPLDDNSETFKLYPSKKPYCTHAYAVSAAGALKIIKELYDFYMPIDLQLISKIDDGVLKAYSINPAVIIQTNDNPSDVSPDAEFLEHKTLINSTLQSLGLNKN